MKYPVMPLLRTKSSGLEKYPQKRKKKAMESKQLKFLLHILKKLKPVPIHQRKPQQENSQKVKTRNKIKKLLKNRSKFKKLKTQKNLWRE